LAEVTSCTTVDGVTPPLFDVDEAGVLLALVADPAGLPFPLLVVDEAAGVPFPLLDEAAGVPLPLFDVDDAAGVLSALVVDGVGMTAPLFAVDDVAAICTVLLVVELVAGVAGDPVDEHWYTKDDFLVLCVVYTPKLSSGVVVPPVLASKAEKM